MAIEETGKVPDGVVKQKGPDGNNQTDGLDHYLELVPPGMEGLLAGYEDGRSLSGKRSGRGRQQKDAPPSHGSEEKRNEEIRAAQNKRTEEIEAVIVSDLGPLFHKIKRLKKEDTSESLQRSDDLINKYVTWIYESLAGNGVAMRTEDFRTRWSTSSGPGGQHMQRTRTAAEVTHVITFMREKRQTRDARENEEEAEKYLIDRLQTHRQHWGEIERVAKRQLGSFGREDIRERFEKNFEIWARTS